ncbi:MAG TPA: DUF4129 domain-containing protein [Euzebyales bacterium]
MASLTPSDLDAGAIRDATEQVLAGPAYGPARPGLLSRVLTVVIDAVAGGLDRVLSAGGGGVALAVVAGAVVVIVVIAWLLTRRVRRDRQRRPRPGRIAGRTGDDWRREAEVHVAQEAWARALRCLYRALLADLVSVGAIDEVAGRTARGYLRDVTASAPDAEGPMSIVTEAFESAWYDGGAVTASDVARVRTAADQVRSFLLVAA